MFPAERFSILALKFSVSRRNRRKHYGFPSRPRSHAFVLRETHLSASSLLRLTMVMMHVLTLAHFLKSKARSHQNRRKIYTRREKRCCHGCSCSSKLGGTVSPSSIALVGGREENIRFEYRLAPRVVRTKWFFALLLDVYSPHRWPPARSPPPRSAKHTSCPRT